MIRMHYMLDLNSLEVTYDRYDAKGNLLQYTPKGGVPVSIIWGYNDTQPIAKIEGARYDNIVNDLITSIKHASDLDGTQGAGNNESAFLSALDLFRTNTALSTYQITTYTYDPLIGVRSITPPSGLREYYKYDTANRLQHVEDSNGHIVKEYQYNYKH